MNDRQRGPSSCRVFKRGANQHGKSSRVIHIVDIHDDVQLVTIVQIGNINQPRASAAREPDLETAYFARISANSQREALQ